jgi:hypothetical protein
MPRVTRFLPLNTRFSRVSGIARAMEELIDLSIVYHERNGMLHSRLRADRDNWSGSVICRSRAWKYGKDVFLAWGRIFDGQ